MSDSGYCKKCGAALIDVCPECHQPVETYSRIVGYLRPTRTWNDGKQQEFRERKEYIVNEGDHRGE